MAETPSELQAEVEKLERKHAENPEGRYFVPLANAYRKLGQLQAAESLLREGLRRHPEYLSAHIVLGRCLADHGSIGEAAEEFRYVLSLDPQNLVALRSLGELSLSAGRTEEAGRWYRELLTADPMNDEARRALESLRLSEAASPPADPAVGGAAGPGEPARGPAEREPEPEELPAPSGSVLAGDEEYAFYGGYVELDEASAEGAEDAAAPYEEEEEDAPELVTETIAELYARQGLFARSADVYRELIRRRGADAALERRLAEVERLAAGEPPLAVEPARPEPVEPLPAVEPVRREPVEPLPAVSHPPAPEPDAWQADRFAVLDDAPGAPAEPEELPEPVASEMTLEEPWELSAFGAPPEPDQEPRHADAAEEPEPTIGRFLQELTAWRPSAAAPEPDDGDLPLYLAPSYLPVEQEAEAVPEDAAGTGSAGEDLFPWELPQPPAEAPDVERAADAEARRGEELFSYADFLSESEPEPAEPTKAEAPPTPAAESPAAPVSSGAEEDDDLESFQAWLRSLKR